MLAHCGSRRRASSPKLCTHNSVDMHVGSATPSPPMRCPGCVRTNGTFVTATTAHLEWTNGDSNGIFMTIHGDSKYTNECALRFLLQSCVTIVCVCLKKLLGHDNVIYAYYVQIKRMTLQCRNPMSTAYYNTQLRVCFALNASISSDQ